MREYAIPSEGHADSFSQQDSLHPTQVRATGRPLALRRAFHRIQRFLFLFNRLLHPSNNSQSHDQWDGE